MFVFIYMYVDVSYISMSWVVVSLFLMITPKMGEMIEVDEHIFHMR